MKPEIERDLGREDRCQQGLGSDAFQAVRSSGISSMRKWARHMATMTWQSLQSKRTGGVATCNHPWCRQASVCTDRAGQCIIEGVPTQIERFLRDPVFSKSATQLQQKPTAGQRPFLLDVHVRSRRARRAHRHIGGTKRKVAGRSGMHGGQRGNVSRAKDNSQQEEQGSNPEAESNFTLEPAWLLELRRWHIPVLH